MDTVFLHGNLDMDSVLRDRHETVTWRKNWTSPLVPHVCLDLSSYSHRIRSYNPIPPRRKVSNPKSHLYLAYFNQIQK